ncbi:MAG: type II toxin-antitoxin system YafQ family toxin [Candidatus Symbiodolus clandestinus]
MRQPRQLNTTNQFEKEVLLAKKRGKDLAKLRSVIDLLLHRAPLPNKLRDHGLQGQYQNYRDLHIEPDWLLIYRANAEELWLVRTGSHFDLFGNIDPLRKTVY